MKVTYYGGNGFATCRIPGTYVVKYGNENEKEFKDYKEAKAFYDNIDGVKAFWDVTGMPELIDGYIEVA